MLISDSKNAHLRTLAHFSRERIPERVVHAKAAGAWGQFEVTKDVTDITCKQDLSPKLNTVIMC